MSDLDIIIFFIAGVAIILFSLYVVISMTKDIDITIRECEKIGTWAKTNWKGELMADIGDICDFCPDEEHDCIMCPLGNPCLNCADYDKVNDICKSNGGCAPERRNDGEKQSD